jgi:uncharacterized repeat protein (TIGR03803 family)
MELWYATAMAIYGTTYQGGASLVGEVFELSPNGTETLLHSFSTSNDGYWPFAGVTRSSGIVYGTTYYGGMGGCTQGCGTVFKISKGVEAIFHSFAGGTTDGCNPNGGVLVHGGNLYGTTGGCGAYGFGTVWKLTSKGVETILHHFAGGTTDGANPEFGNLIVDSAGNLYGVTNSGGSANAGTVFMIDSSGNETILYSFAGQPNDGGDPNGTLVRDSSGNLYGVTSYGGTTNNGTVWKLSASGVETVLHNFNGGADDGAFPLAGVVRASGNLYGVAYYGGINGAGVIWKLTNKEVFSVLHSFDCATDGCCPIGGVVRDSNGNLYGTAYYGGNPGPYGTVWEYLP